MKNIKHNKFLNRILTLTLVCSLFVLNSCEDGLAEINENPHALTNLDYGKQLTSLQLSTTGGSYEMFRTSLGYCLSSIQQMADVQSPVTGVFLPGDKYQDDPLFAAAFFDVVYEASYKTFTDYLLRTSEDPDAVNFYAMGRILKVYSAHRITDIYGDVPYSEAGLGFITNNWTPKYDPQSEIYADMLKELDEAASMLNAGMETPEANDLYFNGDVSKWKKFAYSLMLRLGMRMTKVDIVAAEAWVKKAIAGGVMTSNDDSVITKHQTDGHANPFWGGFETRNNIRLAKTFVDFLETSGDPRLDILSTVESGGSQKGLPNGHDQASLENYIGGSDLSTYSNLNTLLRLRGAPSFQQTYAEVEFLLAEAAARNWGGNAEDHYNNGIEAAMLQFDIFEDITVPTQGDIDAYLAANPYNASNGLEMIGEQYWIATLLNPYEGYANWRRTEFPVLTPVNYTGNVTGGTIPRRLTYNPSEYSLNKENVEAAITRQGPDNFTTRVWWDVN